MSVKQVSSSSLPNTHSMTTRAKAKIFKPKHKVNLAFLDAHILRFSLFVTHNPKGFKSASKHPQWMSAMQDEMMLSNLTTRGPWYPDLITQMWSILNGFFRPSTTLMELLNTTKHISFLMVSLRILGLDYSHTFSSFVKESTLGIVLSLVVIHKWKLHQLDVPRLLLTIPVS